MLFMLTAHDESTKILFEWSFLCNYIVCRVVMYIHTYSKSWNSIFVCETKVVRGEKGVEKGKHDPYPKPASNFVVNVPENIST